MSDTPTTLVTDYRARLKDLEGKFNEIRQVMAQTVQNFKKGIQPPDDLMEKIAVMYQTMSGFQQSSTQVTDQLVQMDRLLQMFAMLNASLELAQVLEYVMDTIIDLTLAERAYLMLYNENGELEIQAARNWERANVNDTDANFSRSVVNAALTGRQAVITTNAATDERFQSSASVSNLVLRSIMCIPLAEKDKLIGVLYADNRLMKGLFKSSMVPVLTLFGQQAAIAIGNAKQFGKVKEDLNAAQLQLHRLEILIDHDKLKDQLDDILETDVFKKIAAAKKERTASQAYKMEDLTPAEE